MVVRAPLPTELSLHRALAVARWGSWLWTAGVVLFGGDDLDHPVIGALAVVASLGIAVAGSVGARGRAWIGGTHFAATQAVVAVGLTIADGTAFSEGHVFATSQNLAAAAPAIAAANIGIAAGPVVGVIAGAAIGATRIVSALLNGVDSFTGPRWASLASTVVYVALFGGVTGWLATTLRRAETEVIVRRERETIARTLHDTVLQTLAVVSRRTDDADLAALARRTDTEVRRFLFGPVGDAAPGRDRPLAIAVRDAAERAGGPFDLDLVVNVVDDDPPATGPLVEVLAGAVSEAVTNAAKHAGGRVVVYAEAVDGELFASVQDSGPGFDPAAPRDGRGAGQGLSGSIRRPIEESGGRVEIDSRPAAGTEVRMWLPWR